MTNAWPTTSTYRYILYGNRKSVLAPQSRLPLTKVMNVTSKMYVASTMYVIVFKYQAPLETIDELKDAHYTNPDGVFAKGMVRFAGPLEPRTGGVIIAEGERSAIEAALASDPFIINGAATVEILQFRLAWTSEQTQAQH